MTRALQPELVCVNTQFSVVLLIVCKSLYARGHWDHIQMTIAKLFEKKGKKEIHSVINGKTEQILNMLT